VGISFATAPGKAWYVPFAAAASAAAPAAEPDDLFAMMAPPPQPSGDALCGIARTAIVAALAPVFASGAEKVAHNSKFDREVLSRHGMPVSMPCHDTMLMHFALDAASRHGLDFLAKSILSYETIPISTLIGEGRDADPAKMAALPPSAILDYAAEDADVALRLYLALKPQTDAAGLSRALAESEEPLVDVLLDIERAGVKVDAVALHDFGRELAAQIAALQEKIFAAAGGPFNLASPKQLGEVLFERLKIDEKAKKTSSGQFATGEDVLLKYAPGNQIVKDILEWRAAEKLRSTYAEKLPACVSRIDGRIHTRLAQSFTETGRLSSSDPNLQNIPVRTEMGKRIRAAFVARDDAHVLISADYSQIELRIMAALSGDEAMIAAFRAGRDIHAETASRVFHVPPEEVTKLQRSQCKAINFGIIYGMSAFGLSQRLEIPRQEAAGFIEEYFRQYPGVKRYMEKAIEDARAKGYAETILGRRRSLPDISSRNAATRQAAERNAVNTPVQGSAADLVKLAMVRVWRALKRENLKAEIILQIHDELLLDAPKDEEARAREILESEMSGAYNFGVPLVVETGSGATWLEAH
jgi:DNA polymerase-1